MIHFAQHQLGGRLDVDLLERHAQRVGQPDRVALGAIAGGETGKRERQNVAARPAFSVHRAGGDDQRMGGVQATRDADHHLRVVQRAQPLLQSRHLDVVGLVAILFQPCGIRRDEREPLDLAAQTDVAGGRVELELDAPERLRVDAVVRPVVVERAHPQPLGAQQLEIDVGDRAPRALGEALGAGQLDAVLPDHRLAVPRQVGGRLPLARSGIHVGRQAARRCRAGQQAAVVGAADRDRAAGQVREHRRAGERGLRARRYRHAHVLADLDMQNEAGRSAAANSRSGPKGTSVPPPIRMTPRTSSPAAICRRS